MPDLLAIDGMLAQLPEFNGDYSFQRYKNPEDPNAFMYRLTLFPLQTSNHFDSASADETISLAKEFLQGLINSNAAAETAAPVTE